MPQTFLRHYLVLTESAGQPGTNFSHMGEESTPYTIHINSTHILLAPFEFCGRIFGQWPTIRKIPLTLLHLYIYVSLVPGRLLYTGILPKGTQIVWSFLD
jgi:hypothetical protein